MKLKRINLSDEQVLSLVKAVVEDDYYVCGVCSVLKLPCKNHKTSKELLIEKFIPLVYTLANKYSTRNTKDDLVGVGLLTLVEIIDNLYKLKDTNEIAKYINFKVMRQIKEYLVTENTIVLTRSTYKKYQHLKTIFSMHEYNVEVYDVCSVDINDFIENKIKNKTEKIIIRCIMEGGYTKNDIAQECGLSPCYVSQIKANLFRRLENVL